MNKNAVTEKERDPSRPICDVYIAGSRPDAPIGEVYPPERDREIKECRNGALRAAKYADWALLELAVERSLALKFEKTVFKKTEYGRWCAEGFDFSLSHAGGYVAVAVSNGAVGVDIESIPDFSGKRASERMEKFRERFFTENEKAVYPDGTMPFLSCWTEKEAVFKRGATGNFDPASIDTAASDARSFRIGDTVLSVSADHISKLRVFTVADGAVRMTVPEKLSRSE